MLGLIERRDFDHHRNIANNSSRRISAYTFEFRIVLLSTKTKKTIITDFTRQEADNAREAGLQYRLMKDLFYRYTNINKTIKSHLGSHCHTVDTITQTFIIDED